jgi:YVTN family beta-propeller protein
VTPNDRTAYVLDRDGGTVTPIDTATDTAHRPIQVGSFPSAIAISGGELPRSRGHFLLSQGRPAGC